MSNKFFSFFIIFNFIKLINTSMEDINNCLRLELELELKNDTSYRD